MRLAYFDCFSGISGDMALGGLVNAGADLSAIVEVLTALPGEEFVVEQEQADVEGLLGDADPCSNRARVVIGNEEPAAGRAGGGAFGTGSPVAPDVLLSASVPDPGPRGADALTERLTTAGAAEAWLTPAVGGKPEHRVVVSAVVPGEQREAVIAALRNEPGVGAIRWTPVNLVPPG